MKSYLEFPPVCIKKNCLKSLIDDYIFAIVFFTKYFVYKRVNKKCNTNVKIYIIVIQYASKSYDVPGKLSSLANDSIKSLVLAKNMWFTVGFERGMRHYCYFRRALSALSKTGFH